DKMLFDWEPDGILCVVDRNPLLLDLIKNSDVPVVDLGRFNEELKMPRVLTDDRKIGRLAAEHLVGMGLRHFAFCRYGNSWGERERHAGFSSRLKELGHACELLEWDAYVEKAGRPLKTINAWLVPELQRMPRPAGILAYNDELAELILRACEQVGLEIPGEIAVLGVDNDPLVCDTARIPLSSVDSNLQDVGYEGAALLYRLLHHASPPSTPILVAPREVAARESTNALAVHHPHVSAAVRYIQQHFTESITADDVARQVGVSRAVLYRAFQKHAPFSITELTTRLRIDYAKQLLVRTPKKADEVAHLCGFSETASLSRAFKRQAGMTPSRFRRTNKRVT
ncbi:MAG: XylR family transcriptional regulator, partial [Chthoniobacterales bacterium]